MRAGFEMGYLDDSFDSSHLISSRGLCIGDRYKVRECGCSCSKFSFSGAYLYHYVAFLASLKNSERETTMVMAKGKFGTGSILMSWCSPGFESWRVSLTGETTHICAISHRLCLLGLAGIQDSDACVPLKYKFSNAGEFVGAASQVRATQLNTFEWERLQTNSGGLGLVWLGLE